MNPLLDLEQGILAEGREWTRQRLEAQGQKAVNEWGGDLPGKRSALEVSQETET